MKHLLLVCFLTVSIACNTKTYEASISEANLAPEKASMATLRTATAGVIDSVKAPRVTKMPDFTKYADVKEKKAAFFAFMRPFMVEENTKLEWERARLNATFELQEAGDTLSTEDLEWINEQALSLKVNNFNIQDTQSRIELTKKIDIIPPAMFLAQAANESSWGTSRFAREANNIFGQWCFTPGCGLVPSKRPAGETHEVQKFATVNDAVASYAHHINSNNAYKSLRDLRYTERQKGKVPSGTICAGGLQKYSARGEEYVKEIRNMIRTNKLEVL